MSTSESKSPQSPEPLPVPIDRATEPGQATSPSASYDGAATTARLGSPVLLYPIGTPPIRQIPTPSQLGTQQNSGVHTPSAGFTTSKAPVASVPTESALAAALKGAYSGSPPHFGTPPARPLTPASLAAEGRAFRTNYGSLDPRSTGTPITHDSLEVVKRHLAGPSALSSSPRGRDGMERGEGEIVGQGLDEDEFSSLRMQGGDVTRPIYRFVEQQQAEAQGISKPRSRSFAVERSPPTDEMLNISSIKQPGGFRRDYIRRAAASPSPERTMGESSTTGRVSRQPPQFLTTSFIEFLSLYGHFAGEEFGEEEEEEESEEYFPSEGYVQTAEEEEPEYGEASALLGAAGKRKRRRKEKVKHGGSPMGAALLLLKSFVGTGVLFLPKAFLNGGMLFSCLVLLGIACLSYYCFILLCSTRAKVPVSFGDMGYKIYGKTLLILINFSLVISQIGFSSAYIVFVSENLQAFIQAVSHCKKNIEVKYLILMQMIIFLPLSLYRNIQNIQKIAVVADIFILLGLLYLYYYDIYSLASHGIADIAAFNRKDWTLFIGTAIFTFEGIGLIIPIQESMKEPNKFPVVLAAVMVIITVVFTSMGALSYAAYGSKTKTVVILNMPQDSKFVNGVQFIYSLAILLSTPLQFFPAIEITSLAIFKRTGKGNPYVKWKKNLFRFFMVVFCALIAWVGADDLDKFVAVVGSFACIPLVYIYPPMLHYKAVSANRWEKLIDIVIMIFGAVAMVYTTALTVNSWVSGNTVKKPGYCDEKL